MRYIFVDEAGTSATEPVTVVVGIIANADAHMVIAENLLNETMKLVPHGLRKDFIFHATDVWNNSAYRDEWQLVDRLLFLRTMMSIPRKLGMAISFCAIRDAYETNGIDNVTPEQVKHVVAFKNCMCRADKYIREYCGAWEVASVIAEDEKDARKLLKLITEEMRDLPRILGRIGMLDKTKEEISLGYLTQESDMHISRIRKAVHFVGKKDDPMVQIADACAFGMRRFFSEQRHGQSFIEAMLGAPLNIADYAGNEHAGVFFWHPDYRKIAQEVFRL